MGRSRQGRRWTVPAGIALSLAALAMLFPAMASGAITFDSAGLNYDSGGSAPNGIATGEFNGDGDPDLAWGNYGSGTAGTLLGSTGIQFNGPTVYSSGGNPADVAVVELTGDGDPELIVANRASDTVRVLIGGPDGTFTQGGSFPAGNGPHELAVADFDGDGNSDVAAVDFFSFGDISVVPGQGGGNFGAPSMISMGGVAPIAITVGNFNGDGDPDLAAASLASDKVSVFLGAAGFGFDGPTDYPLASARSVAVGDFDRDGVNDLAVGAGDVYVMRGTPGGAFAPPASVGSPDGFPVDIAVDDLSRDGDQDLVTAGGSIPTFSVLLGREGTTFAPPDDFYGGEEPVAVATPDMDGDGLPDVAISAQQRGILLARNTGETKAPPPKCFGKVAKIVGTDGNDVLKGTKKADVIAGLDGDDTLKGKSGKDRLCGGDGSDRLIGGADKDRCDEFPADRVKSCP